MSHSYPKNYESFPNRLSSIIHSIILLQHIHILLIYYLPKSRDVTTCLRSISLNNSPTYLHLHQVIICVGVSLFAIHLFVVYDAHMPPSLWEFCTHRFIAYVDLQIFVPHTIFFVGWLHTVLFLFIHKSHKWYLCIYAIFNVLLYV